MNKKFVEVRIPDIGSDLLVLTIMYIFTNVFATQEDYEREYKDICEVWNIGKEPRNMKVWFAIDSNDAEKIGEIFNRLPLRDFYKITDELTYIPKKDHHAFFKYARSFNKEHDRIEESKDENY